MLAGLWRSLFIVCWMAVCSPHVMCASAPSDLVTVGKVILSGNELTRPELIYRELMFAPGDSMTVKQLDNLMDRSRQNLLNTRIFNFVDIRTHYTSSHEADIHIDFVERWLTWVVPLLELGERNLNEWIEKPSLAGLNYGMYAYLANMKGRNERMQLLLRAGYRQQFSFAYTSPFVNPDMTLGWGVEAGLERSRRRAYTTIDNKQVFYKDNSFVFQQYFGLLHMYYRPAHFTTHRFIAGIHRYQFADTLTVLNPRFSPDQRSRLTYLSMAYNLRHDRRDLIAYPLDGMYWELSVTRLGLGFLGDKQMDQTSAEASFRIYQPLKGRWYSAASLNARWTDGSTLAYFNQKALGFDHNLVRGYEYYVIDGQQYVVAKTNLKFALLPQKTKELSFIRSEKFALIHYALYLNIFADAGICGDRYLSQENQLNNTLLLGGGLGLDFVTYYDRVIRVECAMNKLGEIGVYFHLTAPI
jgi:outer membrane protein assembly factor BamA